MEKVSQAQELIKKVRRSTESAFYKNIWNNTGTNTLEQLPAITVENLVTIPLEERLYYTGGRGLVKIIYFGKKQFLVKRTLDELGKEKYGTLGKRPVVLFTDSHESIEKSLWCYEQNKLPCIGEHNNLPVTAFLINRYESDSFLGDLLIIKKLLSLDKYIFKKTKTFNIFQDRFDISEIQKTDIPMSQIHLILGLPETGAFAYSCPSALQNKKIIFHPDTNSIIELKDNVLVVTKLIFMPTPVIRYRTNILITPEDYTCICDEKISFSLNEKSL